MGARRDISLSADIEGRMSERDGLNDDGRCCVFYSSALRVKDISKRDRVAVLSSYDSSSMW